MKKYVLCFRRHTVLLVKPYFLLSNTNKNCS